MPQLFLEPLTHSRGLRNQPSSKDLLMIVSNTGKMVSRDCLTSSVGSGSRRQCLFGVLAINFRSSSGATVRNALSSDVQVKKDSSF